MRDGEEQTERAVDEVGDTTGHDCDDPHCGEHAHQPYRREAPKTGRNDPCPCGSGRKFKKCCLALGS